MRPLVAAAALLLASCVGTGPARPLSSILAERGLDAASPVVLVDIDDTIYDRARDLPLEGAAEALRELSTEHLIVYLTARPTVAKVPGLTHNRADSLRFLAAHGFPSGPIFTSSLWNFLVRGEGGGKEVSLRQLREYGVARVALAVGDRPHDLRVYTENDVLPVERSVIILMEHEGRPDRDRARLPEGLFEHEVEGSGPAWPRILAAFERGDLEPERAYVVSE